MIPIYREMLLIFVRTWDLIPNMVLHNVLHQYMVACQAHPALVKIGPALVPLLIFEKPVSPYTCIRL